MTESAASVMRVEWRRLGSAAPTVLARLAADPSLRAAMPLLDPSRNQPSASPFHQPAALARIIAATHQQLGHALPQSTADRIAAGSPFVIAGQQPMLALGPVFTLLKAATAIALARRLSTADRPVIPAFWIAGEDHDLAEVNRLSLTGPGSNLGETPARLVIDHPVLALGGPRPPVAAVSLEPWRDQIVTFIQQHLSASPHIDWLLHRLSHTPFTSYADMMGSLLLTLFGDAGLVLLDPMKLRPLAAPVIATMIQRWPRITEAFAAGSSIVASHGFDPPLNSPSLFEITPAGRLALDNPAQIDPQTVLDDPARFSPGAALRPVVQDAIIPTLATVAGPTELLYLWQIDPLHRVIDTTRSALWPRLSATFIDHRARRLASRFSLDGEAIFDAARLLDSGAQGQAEDDEELGRIESLGRELVQRIDKLLSAGEADPKLLKRARDSVGYHTRRVVDRVQQRRLEQRGLGRRNLQRLLNTVLPGGALQERSLAAIEMLAQHGPGWATSLCDLNPLELSHHLVELRA
jgi:uncharacterized protein YllA (UPF0747 family)